MRELHGVVNLTSKEVPSLKRKALLFDRFYVRRVKTHFVDRIYENDDPAPEVLADLEFLQRRDLVTLATSLQWRLPPPPAAALESISGLLTAVDLLKTATENGLSIDLEKWVAFGLDVASDSAIRYLSSRISAELSVDTVPLCRHILPDTIGESKTGTPQTVISVALEAMPVPDETSSWEDILEFKSEQHDRLWGFRRFLQSLSTKQQSEAEIRDDLEWTVREYRQAMHVHKLKSSQSFVDVFVITPLEIVENLVKFNWSKIAKGALQVQKRQIELLEAEMKAPGRECAYVFDARQRFGSP